MIFSGCNKASKNLHVNNSPHKPLLSPEKPSQLPAQNIKVEVVKEPKSFWRWGGQSLQKIGDSEKITAILKKYSAHKAGKVELGANESGGKYFHFYIPDEDIDIVEKEVNEVLKGSFYKEKVSINDKKSKPGHSRVVFVLFGRSEKELGKVANKELPLPKYLSREIASLPIMDTDNLEVSPVIRPESERIRAWSEFVISSVMYFSSISSTDKSSGASANFYSKQNFGFQGTWIQHLNPGYSTMLGMTGKFERWDENMSPGKSLVDKSYMKSGFFIGAIAHLNNGFSLSSSFKLTQESFRYSTNNRSAIAFETPALFGMDIEAKKYFNLTGPYQLGLNTKVFSTFPKSLPRYKVLFSPGAQIGLSLKENYSKKFLEVQLFYEQQSINTSTVKEKSTSVGLMLNYSFGSSPK